MSTRVGLIGAHGHGLVHRRAMMPLQEAGVLSLVALCDPVPVSDAPGAPVPAGARVFTGYRELLAATELDVVVIATPPHTHLEIAVAAARAGADVLLEKPPVTSMAEHHRLAEVLDQTGRACQVGFQALGSAAQAELAAAITTGRLGTVDAVSAVGAWQRPDAYYRRAPWAGRRTVDGHRSADGALANPFAHAVMQCLALAEVAAGGPVWPVRIELERYRARPIEVDDTAVLRLRLDQGPPVVVAVTLCADQHRDPEVVVRAERGRAVLEYATDRLRLPGDPVPRQVLGRTGLLANLLAHRADPAVPLLAPLRRTAPFTAVVEAIAVAPEPSPIDASWQVGHGEGEQRVVTVTGVGEVLRRAAETQRLPSELGVAWAEPRPARPDRPPAGPDGKQAATNRAGATPEYRA